MICDGKLKLKTCHEAETFQNLFCFLFFGSLPIKALLWRTKRSYFINSVILLHFWKVILSAEKCRMAHFRLQEKQAEIQFNLNGKQIQNKAKWKHRFYCKHSEKTYSPFLINADVSEECILFFLKSEFFKILKNFTCLV